MLNSLKRNVRVLREEFGWRLSEMLAALVGNQSFRRTVFRFLGDERGAWFLFLLVGLLLNVVAYLILPRAKQPKPEAAKDMDDPTADAGRPVPWLFGTVLIKGLNVLNFMDKNIRNYEVNA